MLLTIHVTARGPALVPGAVALVVVAALGAIDGGVKNVNAPGLWRVRRASHVG
jgi:hypothetical protein